MDNCGRNRLHFLSVCSVYTLTGCTELLGRKKLRLSGKKNFVPTRYALCFFRLHVNSSPLFKKRKKEKEKFFDNLGVKNVCLVEKRRKRAEKICPFKIIILKTKHHEKVGRVGWSARTHPCFVP